MNIENIRNFIVLADCGSVSKAAEKLYISQPALTKQLKKMEAELNCELFRRDTRNLELSKSGEIFLKYASVIAEQYERMQKDIEREELSAYGTLRMGYATNVHRALLERAMAGLLDEEVNAEFSLHYAMPQELLENLRNGKLDCALMHLPSVRGEEDILYERIKEGGLTARMSEKNVLAGKKVVSVADLSPFDILTSANTCPKCRDYANEAFEKAGVPIHRRYVDNMETVELLSKGKHMISLTSEFNSSPGMVQIPIKELQKGFDVVFVMLEKNRNPLVKMLYRAIKRDL